MADRINQDRLTSREEDGGSGQAPAVGPPEEHEVSIKDEATALKIPVRRDCEPDTEMFKTPPEKFRSSNETKDWEEAGRSKAVQKEESVSSLSNRLDQQSMPAPASSIGRGIITDSFAAMPLPDAPEVGASANPDQRLELPNIQQARLEDSKQETPPPQTQSQSKAQTQPQPQLQAKASHPPQPQANHQSQSTSQPALDTLPEPQTQQIPPHEATSTNDPCTEKTKPAEKSGSGNDERKSSTVMEPETDRKKTEDKSAVKSEPKETKPDEEVTTEEKRKEEVTQCVTSVHWLLDPTGNTQEVILKKEELVHKMSLNYMPTSKMKTIYGLAVNLLPGKETWTIDKMLHPQIPGCDIHETGVRNVLKELTTEGKTLGDVVKYFTLSYSKRLDIVNLIRQIHKECPFCDNIFDNVS